MKTSCAALALCAGLAACTPEPPIVARWNGGEDRPALLADLQAALNEAVRGTPAEAVELELEGDRLAVRLEPRGLNAAQLDAVAARLRAMLSPPASGVTLTVPPAVRRKAASPPPVGTYRTTVDWSAARGEAGSRPAYGGLHSAAVSLRQVNCRLVLPTATPLPALHVQARVQPQAPAQAQTPQSLAEAQGWLGTEGLSVLDIEPPAAGASSPLPDSLSPEQQGRLHDDRKRLAERGQGTAEAAHLRHPHRLQFADEALNRLDGASFSSEDGQGLVLLLGDLEGVTDFGQLPVSRYDADCDALLERKHPELAHRIFAARRFGHVRDLVRNPKWQPAS
jgi:hypothetical protein